MIIREISTPTSLTGYRVSVPDCVMIKRHLRKQRRSRTLGQHWFADLRALGGYAYDRMRDTGVLTQREALVALGPLRRRSTAYDHIDDLVAAGVLLRLPDRRLRIAQFNHHLPSPGHKSWDDLRAAAREAARLRKRRSRARKRPEDGRDIDNSATKTDACKMSQGLTSSDANASTICAKSPVAVSSEQKPVRACTPQDRATLAQAKKLLAFHPELQDRVILRHVVAENVSYDVLRHAMSLASENMHRRKDPVRNPGAYVLGTVRRMKRGAWVV